MSRSKSQASRWKEKGCTVDLSEGDATCQHKGGGITGASLGDKVPQGLNICQALCVRVCVCVCVYLVAQLCLTLCDPMDYIACQAPLSIHFPGKNTGVACHFLLQGIFPTQEWNLHLCLRLVGKLFTTEPWGAAPNPQATLRHRV